MKRVFLVLGIWSACFVGGFVLSSCALTDSLGITQSTEKDTNGDGKPDVIERDWSPVVKLVADNIPGVAGVFSAIALSVGTVVMKLRARSREENLKVLSAAGFKIIDLLWDEVQSSLMRLDVDKNGKVSVEELKGLPELMSKIIKERAEEYKAKLKKPEEWEYIVRHMEELLSKKS